MSKLQDIAERAMRKWFPGQEMLINYRPAWLKGMEIDIFLPGLKLGLEVNGSQHRFWVPDMHKRLRDWQGQVWRDNKKNVICKRLGIRLFSLATSQSSLIRLYGNLGRLFNWPTPRKIDSESSVEWRRHVIFLKFNYAHRPKMKMVRGLISPLNKAGESFLEDAPPTGVKVAVRTPSDNRVPRNPRLYCSAVGEIGASPLLSKVI